MTEIPLILRLKKKAHKDIAKAQDLIINCLYKIFNNAVLHGGTSIWRCYNGNRFSEDIDVYLEKDIKKINLLFDEFEKAGFKIEKKKISENSIYSSLIYQETIVRFEAVFKKINSILREYETIEGNRAIVYTLSAEDLIKEKSETYLKRKKIRDLYDVFFLIKSAEIKQVEQYIRKLVKNYSKPEDEENLQTIILQGLVPDSQSMLNYLKSL